jgi:prephenate dehydrogenase
MTQNIFESVTIVGAGAIGGWLGARLAAQGVRVSLLARGATLAALQQHGHDGTPVFVLGAALVNIKPLQAVLL